MAVVLFVLGGGCASCMERSWKFMRGGPTSPYFAFDLLWRNATYAPSRRSSAKTGAEGSLALLP